MLKSSKYSNEIRKIGCDIADVQCNGDEGVRHWMREELREGNNRRDMEWSMGNRRLLRE